MPNEPQENKTMTFGQDENGNGVLLLSPDELERFKRGEPIAKHSGDSKGEFTITACLTRKYPVHQQEARISRLLQNEGEAMYRGFVIRPAANLGYVVDRPKYEPKEVETVNEALHYIDNQ